MKKNDLKIIETVELPSGFSAAGHAAGIKRGGTADLALIAADRVCSVAGTFTTNQVKSATVKLCMERVKLQQARAVIVNSGNANTCNGAQGLKDADRMTALTAELLGVKKEQVFVCSTGKIGVPLPMPVVEKGIRAIAGKVTAKGGPEAALAIMTTDTRPKMCTIKFSVNGKPVTLTGMAKGAGMIEPNMATMLSFILTDAAVEAKAMQRALHDAVDSSFNRITVDGDQSTNDTVLMLASGAAGGRALSSRHPDWELFCRALHLLTLSLAKKIACDGEGATKLITVQVTGARNDKDADIAARSVANSMLVKCAWHGDDPNWGRIMDALGYSSARVVEEAVDIYYDDKPAALNGVAARTPVAALKKIQRQKEFTLTINLNLGDGEAVVYTCDCSEEYVTINV